MEVAAVLYFLSMGVKLHFTVWVPTAKKIYGVSRGGDPLGSGSSNRGESTLLAGESKGDSVPLAGGIQWRAAPFVAGRIQ